MPQPTVSNIAAKSVHLNWVTSIDVWDALTITGCVATYLWVLDRAWASCRSHGCLRAHVQVLD